jgi:hypothetical protein
MVMVMNRIGGWTFHCEVSSVCITIDAYQNNIYYRTITFDRQYSKYYINDVPVSSGILSDNELSVIDELRYQS